MRGFENKITSFLDVIFVMHASFSATRLPCVQYLEVLTVLGISWFRYLVLVLNIIEALVSRLLVGRVL